MTLNVVGNKVFLGDASSFSVLGISFSFPFLLLLIALFALDSLGGDPFVRDDTSSLPTRARFLGRSCTLPVVVRAGFSGECLAIIVNLEFFCG